MNFSKRLRAYLLGILLGFLVVYLLFRDRSSLFTDWLPENRVLSEIRNGKIMLSDTALCQLRCLGILPDSVKNELIAGSRVDFSQSNTKRSERAYCLVKNYSGVETVMMVDIADSTSTLKSLSSVSTSRCKCP